MWYWLIYGSRLHINHQSNAFLNLFCFAFEKIGKKQKHRKQENNQRKCKSYTIREIVPDQKCAGDPITDHLYNSHHFIVNGDVNCIQCQWSIRCAEKKMCSIYKNSSAGRSKIISDTFSFVLELLLRWLKLKNLDVTKCSSPVYSFIQLIERNLQ